MKKIFIALSLVCSVVKMTALNEAPPEIDLYHEVASVYRTNLPELFNDLAPEERVMIYYLYRSALPANRICADQNHRDAVEIIDLCQFILLNKNKLISTLHSIPFDIDIFIKQLETYYVYLTTNHGQYFMKEHVDEKRTPDILHLDMITQDNIIHVLGALGLEDAQKKIQRLAPSIFDKHIEPTSSVAGSIDNSAMNLYSVDFSDDDFKQLSLEEQSYSNSYCYISHNNEERIPKVIPCKIGGKYNQELSICLYWLQKATKHAFAFPHYFDVHFAKSLELFCDFLKSGDEQLFKNHSIEWLQSKSRIDYNIGFVESYLDPKAYRGLFQAEVTIKSIDMNKINELLPILEAQLPFPAEFKRDNLLEGKAQCPNASINVKAFSAGGLGPQNITLAYCLPNYEEIRSKHGSKQIIYASEKRIGEKLNPVLYEQLFHLPEECTWAHKHDPEYELRNTILMLHVILHETLGHGSGKFAQHTFVEGDSMTIDNKTYAVGDSIPVTSANEQLFLKEFRAALEELRAEIIALLSSINNFNELSEAGLLHDWPSKVSKEKIIVTMIQDMAEFALGKWRNLPNCDVSGAHALANTTILYYLIDHNGIELVEEATTVNGEEHSILGVRVISLDKALIAIEDLAIRVQTIKSTADYVDAKNLFDTCGIKVRNPKHIDILKENLQAVMGAVKVSSSIFPFYKPVFSDDGKIIDCIGSWPNNFIEQQLKHSRMQ